MPREPRAPNDNRYDPKDPLDINAMNSSLLANRLLSSINKRQSAYLSDRALKRLNIQCTGLDLNTGMPSDGSETLIRPFPMAKIHSIFKERQPWNKYKIIHDHILGPDDGAQGVLYSIYGHLNSGDFDDDFDFGDCDPPPTLIQHTDWQLRDMEWDEGERLLRRPVGLASLPRWTVMDVLDKIDGVTPHVSCLLMDRAPLRDAQLSSAEICCILAVTFRRFRQREYRNHRFIPVTIVSAAGCRVRIVQGYVDPQEDGMRVRKSPILDLHDDVEQNQKQIELLTSWCIGETVGDTKLKTT
ncbi:hypothetical protein GQX73_g4472 [Xylaria multiplex]|uniref:Uncharacterized protein n=1 Tax=Xylaria multiplex TaxID=323545 RepID=A0A7C8MS21_9PEZI|nr:hypothetical protein GQX73_g4472 [Xylaria multiplex]